MGLFVQSKWFPPVRRRRLPPSVSVTGTLTFTGFASNVNAPQTSKSAVVHVYEVTGVTEILATTITSNGGAGASISSALLTPGTTYRVWGLDATDGAMFAVSLVAS